MKKTWYLSFILFFSFGIINSISAQTAYVKQDASGANDGSSWADAYTDLQVAIDSSTATEIWLAAGTYKPGGMSPTDSSSFILRNNLAIYGGFVGTETELSQRDYMTNESILSGDIAGDDVDNDFENNRTDNVLHVVITTEDVSTNVVLDGLVVVGGNTDGADGSGDNRRGAAILLRGKATVRNCSFRQNYGYFGAGVYPRDSAATGSVIDNCSFTNNSGESGTGVLVAGALDVTVSNCNFQNNFANDDGAGLYATNSSLRVSKCNFTNNSCNSFGGALFSVTSLIQILNCDFLNNSAANAGGVYLDAGGQPAINAIIKSCTFESNTVSGFGGAAFYTWNIDFDMDSCEFKSNSAPHAGAIYNDGRDNFSSYIIKNTNFENNSCGGFGGAVYNWACRFSYNNCTFKNNTTGDTGGGMFTSGSSQYEMKDCVFFENTANGGWGGGLVSYQEGTSGVLTDCEFTKNVAVTSGGGISVGFKSDVKINTSSFNENVANFGAGIYSQNDSSQLTINGGHFKGNRAENNGGGVFVSGGGLLNVDQSSFEVNNADIGGAICVQEDSVDLASLNLSNTTLTFNIAQNQGGGIWITGTDATVTSCLFNGNIALGQGFGGAISNNAANGDTTFLNLINNTIVNNTAENSAGLSFWEEAEGDLNAEILNTISYNPDGINYFIEEGTPNFTSLGGNLSSDNTMATILVGTNDLNETDPLFEDVDDDDYHLSMASPCIDQGIDMGAPALDLEGNARKNAVDMGAYEFQGGVFTEEVVLASEQLEVFPNPAFNDFSFRLENDWNGNVEVMLFNILGQQVLQTNFTKTGTILQQNLAIHQFPKGEYLIILKHDKFLVTQPFVKI